MADLYLRTSAGVLRLVARDGATGEAAAGVAVAAAEEERATTAAIPFVDGPAWFKGGPLLVRAAWRHGLRAHVLRRPLPRVCEYHNLGWLARRAFQVAPPLAAGAFFRGGLPRYQFLVTSEVGGARTLSRFLSGEEPDRAAVLAELGREVGRMHALGFVHRDLFPRNVLVRPPTPEAGRIAFLDAWRGGRRIQLRGPAYDLGCLFLHAPELLGDEEQKRLFEAYVTARAAQDRRVDARSLLRAVYRARSSLRRRLEADPDRLRGEPLPPRDWAL